MKKPTFIEGIVVAFMLSLFGTLSFYFLNNLIPGNSDFYLTVSFLSLFYLLYLFARTGVSTGRVTAFSVWFVITFVSWLMFLPFSIFLMVQLSIIWILRSLYFYSSLFSAFTDLFLTGFSITAAIWAGYHTGTLFLALWCFFLMQSLFVLIPKSLNRKSEVLNQQNPVDDDFSKAYQIARQALGKLAE